MTTGGFSQLERMGISLWQVMAKASDTTSTFLGIRYVCKQKTLNIFFPNNRGCFKTFKVVPKNVFAALRMYLIVIYSSCYIVE